MIAAIVVGLAAVTVLEAVLVTLAVRSMRRGGGVSA